MKAARIVIGFLVILSILLPFCVMGQRKKVPNMPEYDLAKFHFGFVLGFNVFHLTLQPIANLSTRTFTGAEIPDDLGTPTDQIKVLSVTSKEYNPGLSISILANMRMGDYFDLRFIPSLSFGDHIIIYTFDTKPEAKKNVLSTYINFPLEVRFKALRYNNFRPYLMTGVQYSLDLASNAKKTVSKRKNISFNNTDLSIEGGVGFDFYNEWFKFGVEFKMIYGLFDVIYRDKMLYSESIYKLNSKIFQLSLTFE